MLQKSLMLAAIVVFWLSQAVHFATLIPWVLAYALVTSPITPLLDSNALEVANEHQRSYGGLRVWGSIRWARSTWLVGLAIFWAAGKRKRILVGDKNDRNSQHLALD